MGGLSRSGLSFEVIWLSAVWMHLPEAERPRAFRKLVNLLRPGGRMLFTIRQGPIDTERGMYLVSASEFERLARDHGARVVRSCIAADQLGREDVQWLQIAIELPDDGTEALPALRHIILNDDKSSSYKLALLRTLCRIADSLSPSRKFGPLQAGGLRAHYGPGGQRCARVSFPRARSSTR